MRYYLYPEQRDEMLKQKIDTYADAYVKESLDRFKKALEINYQVQQRTGFLDRQCYDYAIEPFLENTEQLEAAIGRKDIASAYSMYAQGIDNFIEEMSIGDLYFSPKEHIDGKYEQYMRKIDNS